MLTRLLQRFSGIALRQDAHPAAAPPPGVERSPYAVDGRERVWMGSHLTAYAKVRRWDTDVHLARDADGHRLMQNGLWVEMEEASQDSE